MLVTGHTGFKGSWLVTWLKQIGCEVCGFSLERGSTIEEELISDYFSDDLKRFGDVRVDNEVMAVIQRFKPDIIFHLAAEAVVSRAHLNPRSAWETNVIGTLNVLEAARYSLDECYIVIVTSDKCYQNREWVWGYRENDTLGGIDPYSASKAACEIMVHSYVESYLRTPENRIRVATARAGNVIGGGDWTHNRVVPDCIRSWKKGQSVSLRNPNATRPWQHVLEPLRGYIYLACSLMENKEIHGESFNFGPKTSNSIAVGELVAAMASKWINAKWEKSVNSSAFKECGLLTLNCDKAARLLGWQPVLDVEQMVEMTIRWYMDFNAKKDDPLRLCERDILFYEGLVS